MLGWEVVVAQLAKGSLLNPEVCGSKSIISNMFSVEKTKIKKNSSKLVVEHLTE